MNEFGLPHKLGNGLLLRWAAPNDTEEVAAFNVKIHSDDPENPSTWLGDWTHDLMTGIHPTTSASDFTVVVDENNDGKIVSSLCLISQEWTYDGIPFKVGRPELVGTDPAYRQRGLVRAQMDVVHAKSAARDEVVQGITGIPWYYRMFGYEMALDLGGSRLFNWHRQGNNKPVDPEPFTMRLATLADLPVLQSLFAQHDQRSLITRLRSEDEWLYELQGAHRETIGARHCYLIETAVNSTPVAYVEYRNWGTILSIRELCVKPDVSWRPICLFITRVLKKEADQRNQTDEKQINFMEFRLGVNHAAYEALGWQLEQQSPPYAWYIRVPDLQRFLQIITPALERRLAKSVLVGHNGTLKLNFYRQHLQLDFAAGKITNIDSYTPTNLTDGDAKFPDLTFLQLLFGRRSFEELDKAFADCYAVNAETAVLLNILFPKQHSLVAELG